MKPMRYMVLVLVFALFSDCKKYPENALWFKNPAKIPPFEGHITKYTVNGIDSLELMNAYFTNRIGLKKSIRDATFILVPEGGFPNVLILGSGLSTGIVYQLTRKKKFMKIGIVVDTTLYKKNIFINIDTEWRIMRLAKTGPFKIETTLDNGNFYQIEIE